MLNDQYGFGLVSCLIRASPVASPKPSPKGIWGAPDKKSVPVASPKALFCPARPYTVSGAPSPSPSHRGRSGDAGHNEKRGQPTRGRPVSGTGKIRLTLPPNPAAPAKSRLYRRAQASQNISRRRFISPIPPISFSLPPSTRRRYPLYMAPPTAPKKMAKKAAKKPPGNATIGAKAPFAKPRKAPAAKKKPEGMTEDQWQQDCLRRKLSTAERKGRRAVELEKKAQAARQHQHVMAGCIAATNASPWSTSMPVYVPGVISPSQAAFYNDGPSATPGCVTPNLSPHYQDALPHGGFNPNNLYSPAYEQREPGPGPDGDPFTGRRGPLEYDGAGAEEDDGVEEEDDEEEDGVED